MLRIYRWYSLHGNNEINEMKSCLQNKVLIDQMSYLANIGISISCLC